MGRYSAKVDRLRDRADFLRDKIERREASPAALSFHEQELDALDWAIEVLDDMVARDGEEPQNVARQRQETKWQNVATMALSRLYDYEPERVERMVANGPDGLPGRFARHMEQLRYGAHVPPADDTRPKAFR